MLKMVQRTMQYGVRNQQNASQAEDSICGDGDTDVLPRASQLGEECYCNATQWVLTLYKLESGFVAVSLFFSLKTSAMDQVALIQRHEHACQPRQ